LLDNDEAPAPSGDAGRFGSLASDLSGLQGLEPGAHSDRENGQGAEGKHDLAQHVDLLSCVVVGA
jgi:hypothetical protein